MLTASQLTLVSDKCGDVARSYLLNGLKFPNLKTFTNICCSLALHSLLSAPFQCGPSRYGSNEINTRTSFFPGGLLWHVQSFICPCHCSTIISNLETLQSRCCKAHVYIVPKWISSGEKKWVINIILCILDNENEDVCSAPMYRASSGIFICSKHNQMPEDKEMKYFFS